MSLVAILATAIRIESISAKAIGTRSINAGLLARGRQCYRRLSLPSDVQAAMTPEFFITSLITILLTRTGVLYTIAFGLGKCHTPIEASQLS